MKFRVSLLDGMDLLVEADSCLGAVQKAKKVKDMLDLSLFDSDKLSQLAYKFAQEASYLDRANFGHSREYLSADDDKRVNDLYRLGLQVLQQLKQEVEGMRRAGKSKGIIFEISKTVALISDGANMLYWAGSRISNSLGYRCNELSKKIFEALRDYKGLATSSNRRDSDSVSDSGDINKAQEWVDYDMKHYGRISEETNKLVREAGFTITKDIHGDYEVVAKR